MVDMDKRACRSLADESYKKKLWPESYVTWEFLEAHPWAMEPGYLQINWNTIPGLYNRKRHLRTLVIEKKQWDHLSDPTHLAQLWELTQNPEDFHRTLALALCWTPFHDSPNAQQKKEYVMSITIVRKPSQHDGLPFLTAAEEFWDSANETTHSLLLVRLHRKSLLFPNIYYDRYGHHFTLMHDTGKGYNVGDPQVFLGALLHNAYTSGKGPSPKAKLPPAFLDRPVDHPLIDSCTREYWDWTKDFQALAGGEHTLEEHFVCLSTSFQPYTHDPGHLSHPRISLWGCLLSGTGPAGLGSLLGPWTQRTAQNPNPIQLLRQIPLEPAQLMRANSGERRRNTSVPRKQS